MMVCDALDRLSTSWASGRKLCRGLLQLALDLRGFKQANVKVFLRRDQFEDASLFKFPDASKLRTGAVELDWEHDELYGLLFRGIRAELPEDSWQRQLSPLMPESEDQGSRAVPEGIRACRRSIHGEQSPARIHLHLDTEALGRHLPIAPARGASSSRLGRRPSPQHATPSRPSTTEVSTKACAPRQKLAWTSCAKTIPGSLRCWTTWGGLQCPAPPGQFTRRWRDRKTARRVRDAGGGNESPGVPIDLENGTSETDERALLDALITLRVVEIRESTNRVNVPDIYRVAARIGRRGGVGLRR